MKDLKKALKILKAIQEVLYGLPDDDGFSYAQLIYLVGAKLNKYDRLFYIDNEDFRITLNCVVPNINIYFIYRFEGDFDFNEYEYMLGEKEYVNDCVEDYLSRYYALVNFLTEAINYVKNEKRVIKNGTE